ncbi:MAG: hypothetical protein CMO78_05205 [Verrucomicrobiales bacterium]|nr:hypothetical protein [Verrucomicrobiales bacterium]
MIEPLFGIIGELAGLTLIIVLVGGFVFVAGISLFLFIKKIKPGEAGVRTGFGGIKVKKDWMLRVPILQQLQIMDLSVKKLEVVRKGKDGLICEDNIRADIEVVFYVRVNDERTEGKDGKSDFHDIKTVATQVGCERASEIELLKQLFEAKFSEALKSAGKLMPFEKLYTERIGFREQIINTIGSDLNGYTLEDVAIDYLEQTPLQDHDPSNVLDSQGREKIIQMTSDMEEAANQRLADKEEKINQQDRDKEVEIKKKDTETAVAQRELDRQNEQHLAQQTREVEVTKAEEQAATAEEVEGARKRSEMATLQTDEDVVVRSVQKDRAELEAKVNLDKDMARLEQEKLESGEQAEVDRERRVGLASQEKEAKITEAAFEVEKSRAGLESEKKGVTTQHQQRLDVEADMSAERARRVLNIEAEARAEAEQKKDLIAAQADYDVRSKKAEALKFEEVTKAESDKLEAEQQAEQIQITADAEAKASEKRNHAMKQEAEGTAALQAAAGYAEANVTKAKAEAKIADAEADKALGMAEAAIHEAQGTAAGKAKAAEGEGEAKGIKARGDAEGSAIQAKGTAEGVAIEAKGVAEGKSVEAIRLAEAQGAEKMGLAEALAKTEMAKAIELFNKASQDHEEFRLQLDKDKDVELADINIKKDIADAQARVMGEALKSANIDLVGGEQDFFNRVVSSVSQGKVVDRLVDNSQTITDVKNTFFNGDPDHLKNKLSSWIKSSGLKSEDVKNLTISALLASMISNTEDNSLRGLMRAAEKAVRGTEVGNEMVDTILGDKLGK